MILFKTHPFWSLQFTQRDFTRFALMTCKYGETRSSLVVIETTVHAFLLFMSFICYAWVTWNIKGFVRHEHPTVYILVVIGIVSKLHPIEVLTFNSRRNLNMCAWKWKRKMKLNREKYQNQRGFRNSTHAHPEDIFIQKTHNKMYYYREHGEIWWLS